MGTLIIIVLSNYCTMFFTAWLLHRQKTGASPMPAMPSKADVETEDVPVIHIQKGRPVL